MTIRELIRLKESEDKIEFKEANGGNFSYNGGTRTTPSKRRRCILGYVTAFSNEGGGYLVLGVKEGNPHTIVGTNQSLNNLGQLESDIYRDSKIRVHIEELFDLENKRVVVINIPSRPTGKLYKFEDVPLMRVGEELKPMSDEKYLSIVQEQEPDYSHKICPNLTIEDLDPIAINKMQEAYAKKQKNPQFLTLSQKQVLIDLDLVKNNKVTNAAVILLGKEDIIKAKIPQSAIKLEYRKNEGKITFDNRYIFSGAFFSETDRLWDIINLRNGAFPIQDGPFIFDIPYFNKEVIREAINNAVAHRNYAISSEIVIKQFDSKLEIISPGGFPLGVSLDNLITISSTPRNRLLTDVLQKTGIVERSGQGIDKIYFQTLKEGKSEPDYSRSDDFQVELRLSAVIQDKAFALFIESIQSELADEEKLSVQEIIHLNSIRKNKEFELDKPVIKKLVSRGLIEKLGKTSGTYYILSKSYYEFSDEKGKYSRLLLDQHQAFTIILMHLKKFESAKMKDFVDLFHGQLTRKQVRNIVTKLVDSKELKQNGKSKGTFYTIGENHIKNMEVVDKVIELGLKHLNDDEV